MTVEILAVFWVRFMTKRYIHNKSHTRVLYLMWPVM